MNDEKYIDAFYTYKYLVLMIKELRKNNTPELLFECVASTYRLNILGVVHTICLDLFLTEDNIPIKETDDINTYGLLAIKHYTKFIEEINPSDINFKGFGKILLKSIKVTITTECELPSWVD